MPTTGKRKRDDTFVESDSPKDDNKRARTDHGNLTEKLRKLAEFWFSAANLSRDKYLTSIMISNDGWVPTSLFLNFNRVKALSAGNGDIISALRAVQHPSLEFQSTDDTETRVRLVGGVSALEQVIDNTRRDEEKRTIYIETLPSDMRREQLSDCMEKFGAITYLSIPRYPSGKCKGFAFIEFATTESANKALQHIGEVHLNVANGSVLRAITLQEWRRRKEAYKERMKETRKATWKCNKNKNETEQRAQTKTLVQNRSNTAPAREKPQTGLQSQGTEVEELPSGTAVEPGNEEDIASKKISFEEGLIVSISGLSASKKTVTRSILFKEFGEFGAVAYVDFSPKTADTCTIRYKSVSSAQKAANALSPAAGNLILGVTVQCNILDGECEEAYWEKIRLRREAWRISKEKSAAAKAQRRVAPRVQPKRSAKKELKEDT